MYCVGGGLAREGVGRGREADQVNHQGVRASHSNPVYESTAVHSGMAAVNWSAVLTLKTP